jgi:molybdenum cofactor cytidylyltransferase
MAHHPKLSIVANPFYEAGISTSILAGLGQAEEAHDHVMILLGDMPGIRTAVIDRLIESYLASGRPLGAVCVKGRRSHPVIFGRSLYPDLRALKGDTGARPVFAAHADDACLLDLDYDDRDIDTPKDYEIR